MMWRLAPVWRKDRDAVRPEHLGGGLPYEHAYALAQQYRRRGVRVVCRQGEGTIAREGLVPMCPRCSAPIEGIRGETWRCTACGAAGTVGQWGRVEGMLLMASTTLRAEQLVEDADRARIGLA